jgi:hypothetical protein
MLLSSHAGLYLLLFPCSLHFQHSTLTDTLEMPPATRHWTTALLLVLTPFCLSARLPWQLAFLVPALFVVDLYRRSQRPRREPIRSIGREKRKVRRLNGRDGTVLWREEVSLGLDVFCLRDQLTSRSSTKPGQDGELRQSST